MVAMAAMMGAVVAVAIAVMAAMMGAVVVAGTRTAETETMVVMAAGMVPNAGGDHSANFVATRVIWPRTAATASAPPISHHSRVVATWPRQTTAITARSWIRGR